MLSCILPIPFGLILERKFVFSNFDFQLKRGLENRRTNKKRKQAKVC
jgi:hypothetical protein